MFKILSFFGNDCVLQKKQVISINGTAQSSRKIFLQIDDKIFSSEVVNNNWEICIPPFSSKKNVLYTFFDELGTVFDRGRIHFGRVYLFLGQSNMEFPISDEIKQPENNLKNENPRNYLQILEKDPFSIEPCYTKLVWKDITKTDCCTMSAIAFHTMEQLREVDEPIGVIELTKGGTSILSWLKRSSKNKSIVEKGISLFKESKCKKSGVDSLNQFVKKVKKYEKQKNQLKLDEPLIEKWEIIKKIGRTPWPPPMTKKSIFAPNAMWEKGIAKLKGLKIESIIWYQGEEDVAFASYYKQWVSCFITDLRTFFEQKECNFIIIQLPRFYLGTRKNQWAMLRLQQTKLSQTIPNVDLVITIDTGEIDNIYPANKKTISIRLAELLKNKQQYSKTFPSLENYEQRFSTLVLTFSGVNNWVITPGVNYIRCQRTDHSFFYPSVIFEKNQLIIEQTEKISAIDYACSNFPLEILYNEEGSPLGPFRIEQIEEVE